MVNQNNILDILKTSPSVALLKARSSGIIIDFLTRVYGDVAAVSHENIHSLLAEYLNSHGFDEDDESDILYTDTYEEKATKYIRKWTDSGFLTNYRNEDGEIYSSEMYKELAKIIKQGQKEGSVVEGNAVYLSDLYWGIVYLNSLKLLYMENHKLVTKDTLNRLLLKDK